MVKTTHTFTTCHNRTRICYLQDTCYIFHALGDRFKAVVTRNPVGAVLTKAKHWKNENSGTLHLTRNCSF